MSVYTKPSKKKVSRGTGGRRGGKYRDKKLSHLGRSPANSKVADKDKREKLRCRGATSKIRLKKSAFVNVVAQEGKTVKAKIIKVLESHNPEFIRQNIVTKGAVLETDKGKVKVTNRVGQDGIVNGVLV
ncbi:30S ribosomal protein S8e [Candidatus Micrarchaeota archaeon]|nr:30S ribosomal protein S8e [Candidatus Micrarchaeota archaeon]